jgi:hypothetical protein
VCVSRAPAGSFAATEQGCGDDLLYGTPKVRQRESTDRAWALCHSKGCAFPTEFKEAAVLRLARVRINRAGVKEVVAQLAQQQPRSSHVCCNVYADTNVRFTFLFLMADTPPRPGPVFRRNAVNVG